MEFFSSAIKPDSNQETVINPKLEYAPLTNLGSESEFAKFDNRVRISGGTTSVQSLARKNVVATNAYLVNSEYLDMDIEGKRKCWKWARGSNQVKEVKTMEADFLATVKQAKQLALLKKEQLKKKKNEKTIPITPNGIELLESLTEQELLTEISYLRNTVAPNIRQRRRVKTDDGKYKMEKFSTCELKTSIRNAVKPENELVNDINQLLKSIF